MGMTKVRPDVSRKSGTVKYGDVVIGGRSRIGRSCRGDASLRTNALAQTTSVLTLQWLSLINSREWAFGQVSSDSISIHKIVSEDGEEQNSER